MVYLFPFGHILREQNRSEPSSLPNKSGGCGMNGSRCLVGIAALSLLVASIVAPGCAAAQVAGGTVLGVVRDTSGARVSKAEVSIKNTATGVTSTVTTNEIGLYRVPNLIPGNYEVTASASGFATTVETDLTLGVGAELAVNIQLRVGAMTEQIQVTGEVPDVSTTNSTVSAVVDERTVRELPLNARDWTALATLEPGVATVRTAVGLNANPGRANRGWGTQMTIGGNRPQQNNYRMNGVSINDYGNGAPGSVLGGDLGVDAIQEFSVVTSNAQADYGRSSGGIINAITRSGTNALHGSAYEFIRNSALDARNPFDFNPVNGQPFIPPFKRNQFGGTSGGRIRKDKMFIFGDYEGLRQSLGNTQNVVVLSPSARAGVLANGTTVKIDPNVLPYLQLIPAPNGRINGDRANFIVVNTQVATENYFTTRFDNRVSNSDSLNATYMFDSSHTTAPDPQHTVLLGTFSRRQLVTLEETHTFRPNMVNTARFGFSRVVAVAPKSLSALNPIAADTSLGFVPGSPVGAIAISGLTRYQGGLGAVGEYDFHFNSFQFYDDALFTKGIHSLKFGVSVERIQANQIGRSLPTGQYSFGTIKKFLTNQPTSFSSGLPGLVTPRDLRQLIFGVYFLEDMRLRSNLVLNLGLRYEMATVPTETRNRLTSLHSITDVTPVLGSPYFSNPTLRNFEPRVGFSWSPYHDDKTAVRGAFGIYDVLPLTYEFQLVSILSAPFFESGTAGNLAAGTFPKIGITLLTPNTLRYLTIQARPPRNYVMQWNLNVQREVVKDLSLSVGYVGSHGVHQPFRSDDSNIVLPLTKTAQGYLWPTPAGSGTRVNPNVGQVSALYWVGSSLYDSLQVHLVKRMNYGLQFGASYTWAKNIDDGSSTLAGNAFGNSISSLFYFDSKLRRGLSDFDIRNNFVLNYIWQIAAGKSLSGAARWALGGWQFGGIYQASSGPPFTPLIAGDPLGMLSASEDTYSYPDRLSGPGCGTGVNVGNPLHYIKTECFAAPNPITRLGNAGRNAIIGPGLSALDLSLVKNTQIRQRFTAQFRFEVFNALNRSNFAPPINNNALFDAVGSSISTAGLIDQTATSSRQLQFGLKLIW
jgi:hypothetical protein